jgi:alkanesulfonate monooxygenase SsuD/methylene tetrahydromethanopterin reductase-like flavin-dependent oxidoreductase (luciferase family)
VRFGATTVPNVPWAELVARWRELDAMPRVESVWVPDHLFKGWYECWTTLAGLAHETARVRIGPLVSPATLHEPKRLARAAFTLDDASGGRVELGIGTGGDSRRFGTWTDEVVSLLGDIPLTVGGAGETAVRVAAEHASRWNYSPGRDDSRDEARRRGRELNAWLDKLTERPIVRSALIAYPFTAEDDTPLDELVGAWADAGFGELILAPSRFVGEG